jgi:hypothetical protein
MMRKLTLFLVLTFSLSQSFSQSNRVELSDKIQLTYGDLLDLRLQILAAQMTCGSFSIIDMGGIDYPVTIYINEDQRIVFEIEKNIDNKLPINTQREIIEEGFVFVKTAINELFRMNFKNLNFDLKNNLIGYWYYSKELDAKAKWEKGQFGWIEAKK